MSLFRLREWWCFSAGDDASECSSGALCAAKLSDKSSQGDFIVAGSLSGLLRVFDVVGSNNGTDETVINTSTSGAYKAEHMLLEKQLDYPILQLSAGFYVSSNEKQHLAVLHPRKLAVYSFGSIGAGQVEHGNQYELNLVYEHFLQRTAFNFVDGPFGHISGRDFFCVQSIDGTVSIYEQENFAFTRFLPGSLLPGPLIYLRRADSFVTVSSQWQVEAYKYQVLAIAADAKSKEDAEKSTSGKRVSTDWSYRLGEMVLSAQAAEISPAPPSIMILGERSIYCLTDSGQLRFMKKLDYEPSCMFVYGATSEGFLQYVIASHTRTLLFYADTTLKWAAQASFSPVAIRTASFGLAARNMIVALNDFGSVLCAYLGTDPALYGIPVSDKHHLDYASKQTELRQLQAAIKKSKNDMGWKQNDSAADDMKIAFSFSEKQDSSLLSYDDGDGNSAVTVQMTVTAKQPLENIRLFILSPPPIIAHPATISWPFLRSREELVVTFAAKDTFVPAHLQVKLQACYGLAGSVGAKTYRTSLRLPLTLVAKPCDAGKSAVHKITIDSNKSLVNLNEIFPEFVPLGSSGPLQSMGFQLHAKKSPPIAILASKQSQKYRVQCDSFEQIPVFLKELIMRLKQYYSSDSGFRLSYTGSLPLAEYFVLVDQHFECYRKKAKLNDALGQKAAQFRAAERQLLMKLNETVPSQMTHVDAFIEMTYRQIASVATSIQDLDDALRISRSTLSAGTHLFITLVELLYQLTPSERRTLENVFYADGDETSDQAWEEQVDAGLVYLIQTMSKSSGNSTSTASSLQQFADSTRLKKHIVLLTEKMAKGLKLPVLTKGQKEETNKVAKNAKDTGKVLASKFLEPIAEDTNWKDVADAQLGEAEVPTGSAFGKLTDGHLQPISSSLPPLTPPANNENTEPEVRPSASRSSKRDEDYADGNSNSKSDDRVRSTARNRSRSANRKRSIPAAEIMPTDNAVQHVDEANVNQSNAMDKKRSLQRLETPSERIESESFNVADDETNGFF